MCPDGQRPALPGAVASVLTAGRSQITVAAAIATARATTSGHPASCGDCLPASQPRQRMVDARGQQQPDHEARDEVGNGEQILLEVVLGGRKPLRRALAQHRPDQQPAAGDLSDEDRQIASSASAERSSPSRITTPARMNGVASASIERTSSSGSGLTSPCHTGKRL